MNRRKLFSWMFNGDILPADMATVGNANYVGAAQIPAATVTAVAALSGAALTVNEAIGAGTNKLVVNLTKVPITVTDALAYGSLQLIDFAAGRLQFLGCTASIQWAVSDVNAAGTTVTRAAGINDSASLTWALGTAAASNITLASTMIDINAKATKVLSAATTAFNTASTSPLAAASSQLDGTATAKDMFLNVGFETNTDIDADGVLWATGFITLVYANFGDY
jgi:hypothetical protein